jgi:hypothetical protein
MFATPPESQLLGGRGSITVSVVSSINSGILSTWGIESAVVTIIIVLLILGVLWDCF